ncbi:MAG: MFS transporter [Jatrophihabitantaceae bacterium]
MRARQALRSCLPSTKHERDYALITTVDSLGTGSFLTISVVLFVRLIGVSPTQVGTVLGIGGVISVFSRVPLGWLSDRIGHRRSLIGVHLARGLAFPGYLIIHGVLPFAMLSIAILIIDGWESPIRKVVLYAFAPIEDRVRIAAYNRSVYNLAFSVGSLLAALALIDQHGRLSLYLVVLGNAASFLLAAALAARLPASRQSTGRPAVTVPSRQYALVGFLLGCLFLCTSILTIGLPLLILQNFHSQQWLIGLGMAVNTAIAITLQVRLSRGTSDLAGAVRAGLLGGLFLALACLLLFTAANLRSGTGMLVLLLAVSTLSIGELLASAATWGLSMSLRRHDLTAHNQSIWSMYISLPQLLGPFVVAWALHGLHNGGWLAMGAFILIATGLLGPVASKVQAGIDRAAEFQPAN